MAQQATDGENETEEQTAEEVTRRNPIDWLAVEDDTLGTHTFDADLYDADTFDKRRPAYYRTGQTRNGHKRQHAAAIDRAPSTAAVEDFITSANTPADAIRQDERTVSEQVAITPTEDELDTYKDEFDSHSRSYEPHFLRVPFFGKRIVEDAGLAAAYGLVIRNARNADDPEYGYKWEADYEAGEVTITVTRTNGEKA